MDEVERQEMFVDSVGGHSNAERLLRIWKNSYPSGTAYDRMMGRGRSREDVFRSKAKRENYSNKSIEMFLNL